MGKQCDECSYEGTNNTPPSWRGQMSKISPHFWGMSRIKVPHTRWLLSINFYLITEYILPLQFHHVVLHTCFGSACMLSHAFLNIFSQKSFYNIDRRHVAHVHVLTSCGFSRMKCDWILCHIHYILLVLIVRQFLHASILLLTLFTRKIFLPMLYMMCNKCSSGFKKFSTDVTEKFKHHLSKWECQWMSLNFLIW